MRDVCERSADRISRLAGEFSDVIYVLVLLCPIDSTKCENKFCLTLHLRHKLCLVEKSLPPSNSVSELFKFYAGLWIRIDFNLDLVPALDFWGAE
jgi:hypothetical protein